MRGVFPRAGLSAVRPTSCENNQAAIDVRPNFVHSVSQKGAAMEPLSAGSTEVAAPQTADAAMPEHSDFPDLSGEVGAMKVRPQPRRPTPAEIDQHKCRPLSISIMVQSMRRRCRTQRPALAPSRL